MRWQASARRVAAGVVALAPCWLSCSRGSDVAGPAIEVGAPLTLATTGLLALDPAREGAGEAWVIDGAGRAHSAGRFAPGAGEIRLENPAADVRAFEVTIEPPG